MLNKIESELKQVRLNQIKVRNAQPIVNFTHIYLINKLNKSN